MAFAEWQLLHLRVTAEADPAVLARVLERFQKLNITPRKVLLEWGTTSTVHVEVAIAGLSEPTLDLIAAKLGQVPSILNAYWHH
jgi:hypothetical protein